MNFGLSDLEALVALAELTSFRKAAESVHLSQPALSRRIAKLEGVLGVRLFDRTTRSVEPTVLGREFAAKRSVTWAELGRCDYIALSKSSGNQVLIDSALARMRERPRSFYEVNHNLTLLGLVEAGLGVTAVPKLAMPQRSHPTLAAVPLVEPTVTRRLGLIRRRGRSLLPVAQELYALIAAEGPARTREDRARGARARRLRRGEM